MGLDDVELTRIVENIRYIAKRSTMDNELRNRILFCMEAFDNIINFDRNMANELSRDLIIIRALVKKESEDLERKFTIFEKKIRKVASIVAPKESLEDLEKRGLHPLVTTVFQDNDVRIIDTTSHTCALQKMEEAREMARKTKEIKNLADVAGLPVTLKCNVLARLTDVLNLLRVDGSLALKLKKDILDAGAALNRGRDGVPELENKTKIIKLKVEKCCQELEKKEDEYGKLIQDLHNHTETAIQLLDESTKGYHESRRPKRSLWPAKAATDWLSMGLSNRSPSYDRSVMISGDPNEIASHLNTSQAYTSGQTPGGPHMTSSTASGAPMVRMPSYQSYMLVPVDPSVCPGGHFPGTYGAAPQPGYYPGFADRKHSGNK